MVRQIESKMKSSETIKFLCSYGGKILPRSSDGKLRYVGGLTRVLSVDRSISFTGSFCAQEYVLFLLFVWKRMLIFFFSFFTELMVKLVEFCGYSVTLRCQLPNGDLDTLISIRWWNWDNTVPEHTA